MTFEKIPPSQSRLSKVHMRRDMEIRPHQNISKGTAGPIPYKRFSLILYIFQIPTKNNGSIHLLMFDYDIFLIKI